MVKIIQDHESCIGCGSCAAICPKFWEMPARNASRSEAGGNYEEGKSFLKGAKKNERGEYELEVKNIECNQEAVDACPVQAIKVVTSNE